MSDFTRHARTHTCGQLRAADEGKEVTLVGWVHRRRDHGGLVFVDLRDRFGVTQVVLNPQIDAAAHELAHALRAEFILQARGKVSHRPAGTVNEKLDTGEIEVYADHAQIISQSKTPPFVIEEGETPSEAVKLKYRYLEMRRGPLARALEMRHRVCMAARRYLDALGFLEVETPMLTKSTPEGARDFLAPSRLSPGKFFALPQSPQLFKQLLMVGGMDRYFQIVKCFRDEDLRADRQPEFTQIDMEMSFVDEEEVRRVCEGLIGEMFMAARAIKLDTPFPLISYADAMNRFGVDRPDLRFGMELAGVSALAAQCEFKVFKDALAGGGAVRGMAVPGGAAFSRKDLEDITNEAIQLGAKGLAWIKVTGEGYQSPIAKFFQTATLDGIREALGAGAGDLMVFVADSVKAGYAVLGALRLSLGHRLGLIDGAKLNFVWVVDFPLLEYDEEEKRYVALHHPFTSPKLEDIALFDTDPGKMRARAYDLVLNGSEIGGGSIRIHQREVQDMMFRALSIGPDEAREKFGFLLEAFEFGAPPHGGIAFGLDRICAILTGAESIRDVIAFPKTQKGACLLTDAPSEVAPRQLKELGLKRDLS
ncbi:MAG: aspartate--tRNA ligase [Nitrospinae bacterium]|nr:aspartate--tRNA ligase [Nitrospinota bacterium]